MTTSTAVVMSSGQHLTFKGYTSTRYYPSITSESFPSGASSSAHCVPWKELFDCTWRADLRVWMLRDLTAGRYGFQHHRIEMHHPSSSSASRTTGPDPLTSFYDLIYHIDMDVDTLKKVAKDPNGVLDDPEVPTLFQVFEHTRIWICSDLEM